MKRAIVWFSIISLLLVIMGCGNDNDENGNNDDQPPPPAYLNTKFQIKIENLPTDKWTFKKLGSDGQGMKITLESASDFYDFYRVFLMEPVPSKQFIDLDEKGNVGKIIDAGMPFIEAWLYDFKDTEIKTRDLPEFIKAVYADIEIKETKPITTKSSCYGYQVVAPFNPDLKVALSYFTKREIMLSINLVTKESQYDQYVEAYNNIVDNLTMMGQ